MIFLYHIENTVNASISAYCKVSPSERCRKLLQPHSEGLETLLLISPELKQEALRSLTERLKKLVDAYNETVYKVRQLAHTSFSTSRELLLWIALIEDWVSNTNLGPREYQR